MIYAIIYMYIVGCFISTLMYKALELKGYGLNRGWQFTVVFWPALPVFMFVKYAAR